MGSDLLTTSRMSTYRKCQRRERIEYVEGWRPVETAEALRFGTLWHVGMEAWWNAMRDNRAADALADALADVAGKCEDAFEQARLDTMLRGYDARWRAEHEADAWGEPLGVEEEFRAPLINPESMQPSRTWRLAGKVDVRLRREERTGIVEHKSSSEDITPGADYWLKLQMDAQVSIYTIGAEVLGDSPSFTVYDVAKKIMLRPSKATPKESRKYTAKGALYANMRDADETVEEYERRCWVEVSGNLDKYFQRKEIPRTESQLAEFLDDAWALGRSMRENHLAGRAPRNPDACHSVYGRCPWWSVCSTGEKLDEHPHRYRRISFPHSELTEEAKRPDEREEERRRIEA